MYKLVMPFFQNTLKFYNYANLSILKKKTQIKTHNKTSYPKTNKFILNNSIATETMYKLFIEQKAYSEALGVLEILFQNKEI